MARFGGGGDAALTAAGILRIAGSPRGVTSFATRECAITSFKRRSTAFGRSANVAREVRGRDGKAIPPRYTAGEVSFCFKFVYQSGGNHSERLIVGQNAARQKA